MADTKQKNRTSSKSAKSNTKKEPDIPKKTSASSASRSGFAKNAKTSDSASKPVQNNTDDNFGSQQGMSIVLFGVAAFLLFLVLIEGESVWFTMHNAIHGVFGFCSYVIPLILGYVGFTCAKNRPLKSIAANLISAGIFVVFLSSFIHLVKSTPDYLSQTKIALQVSDTWRNTGSGISPGVLGAFFGGVIGNLFGKTGALVTVVILMITALMFFTGLTVISVTSFMSRMGKKGRDNYSRLAQEREERRILRIQHDEEMRLAEEAEREKRASKAPPSISDEIPPVAPSKKSNSDSSLKIPTISGTVSSGAASALIEPAMPKAAAPAVSNIPSLIPAVPSADSNIISDASDKDAASVRSDAAEAQKKPTKKNSKKEADTAATEKKPPKASVSETAAGEISVTVLPEDYVIPSVDLLDAPHGDNVSVNVAEIQRQGANKLIETLESFKIHAQVTNIVRGPSVTRYELVPEAGIRISKITSLSDDIALRLAADSVRIEAPIPGKSAIGIEVPNDAKSMVTMREIIDTDEYRRAQTKSKLSVALGKDITGKIVLADIAKMPHLLVAGTTGSGKSVCLNTMIISLLYNATPDEVKLVMIDPKQVEFTVYDGIGHLEIPVVSNPRKATGALGWAVGEMEKRYKLFAEQGVRDIDGFNKLCRSREDLEKMHRIVIFIDELSDLMMTSPKEVEDSICRLAQMARAAGIHLVLATQRPTVDVITGLIKANIPSRIALKVSQANDSRIIIDQGGAEKLLGNGDLLFAPVGSGKPTRVQGCYISDDEVERVVSHIRSQSSAEYSDEIMREIEAKAAASEGKHAPDDEDGDTLDPMYNQAVEVVIQAGQASTTMLQKKLKLGYARASRVMDQLEETGVVGPSEGAKPRQVLISSREWYERQALAEGVAANKNVQMSFGDIGKDEKRSEPFMTGDSYDEYDDSDEENETVQSEKIIDSPAVQTDGFADIYEDDSEDDRYDEYEDISSVSDSGVLSDDLYASSDYVPAEEFSDYINSDSGTDSPVEIPVGGESQDDYNIDDTESPEEISLDYFENEDDNGPEEIDDFYSDDDEFIDPPVNVDDFFADDGDFAGRDDY